MKAFVPICPKCKSDRIAQVDRIIGYAGIQCIAENGDIMWDGETDVDWDSQTATTSPPTWSCKACGHTALKNVFMKHAEDGGEV